MTDLEKFLRRASRGLWGRERQTVRQELESHIRHRANRYEVSGSSELDAIKLAITDLGEARAINVGMKGVYNVPTTVRFGVLTAALATFGFMGAQLSTAQVTGTTLYPTPACLEQQRMDFQIGQDKMPCQAGWDLFISIESLRKALMSSGVGFSTNDSSQLGETIVRSPEGWTIKLHEVQPQNWQDSKGKDLLVPIVKGFVNLRELWTELGRANLTFKVEGWEKPRITIGQSSFTIDLGEKPVYTAVVYDLLLRQAVVDHFAQPYADDGFTSQGSGTNPFPAQIKILSPTRVFAHTIRTRLQPGNVVVIVSREAQMTFEFQEKSNKSPNLRRIWIAPVAADGTVQYTSYSRTLAVVNRDQITRGVPNGHATIALSRFTGEYARNIDPLEPIAPDTIKVTSR
jgi:hypothetical protein